MRSDRVISDTVSRKPARLAVARVAGCIGRVLSVIVYACVVCSLIAVVAVSALPLFGYRATVITGGSMKPAIPLGSLIVSQREAPDTLQEGDIVTFRAPSAAVSVTHRITKITELDGRRVFTTKGDANDSPDPTDISFSDDVYKVSLAVPRAGYAINFVRSPQGLMLLLLLPAIGLAMLHVLRLGEPKPKEEPTGG
jgi:signal peptidase